MKSSHDFAPDRRQAIRTLGLGLTALGTTPLLAQALGARRSAPRDELGRLRTRHSPATQATPPGIHRLGVRERRDGVVYVPPGYDPDTPIHLVVLLHGAGGTGAGVAGRFKPYADELGLAFVAPDSTEVSWDRGDRLTKDVVHIDAALAVAYRRINTKPEKVRIA